MDNDGQTTERWNQAHPTQNVRNNTKAYGTLLIGSSVIHNVNTKTYELDIKLICLRGRRICDVTNEVLKPITTNFENGIHQAGSNLQRRDLYGRLLQRVCLKTW